MASERDKPADRIVDYLAERIEPAANTDTLSESALYADYAAWCCASGRAARDAAEFVAEVDRLRVENDLGDYPQTQGSLLRHPTCVSP